MTPDQTDLPVVGVDLDGTLAASIYPNFGIGPPIAEGFRKLALVVEQGWEPVIHTSRGWWAYDAIKEFMAMNGYPHIRVVCGKFLAAAYIDDRAIRADDPDWTPRQFS